MGNTFYSESELENLGLKKYGTDVLISRNAILYHPDQLEIGDHVRIDDFVTISRKVVLGSYIHISQFCSLYGGDEGIYMDDFSTLSSKVSVYATSNDYSGKSMTNPMVPAKYKPFDKNAEVKIGRHVVVGSTSVILPGITIEDGCAVGAMTLCNKSMDAFGIYAGVPAKRIKERERTILELEKQMLEESINNEADKQ